ncbi:hypothetical protein PsorP6_003013 [Peronosclerospora sorghi]|uniref:Uncharacterized protein n=1 Tax=Peronosclerospora sorghi TaxID=230839 RepID=A0ACC0VR34_9STRA|nr:hypothetical protein PsorP6_003013 [Peronosclerospora sorghi]
MHLPTFRDWTVLLLALPFAARVTEAQIVDVIIVGSGPGGLVAAEYLSRDPNVSVIILEAGPPSLAATGGTDPPGYDQAFTGTTKFDVPGEFQSMIYNPADAKYVVDWISDANLWLGKLVGGCSSTNAAIYTWPPDSYVTKSEWPYSAAQMVAKMQEIATIHGHTDVPSADGRRYLQEGYAIVAKALRADGYNEASLNDEAGRNNNKVFGHIPLTIHKGRRDSAANAFWGKMKARPNVKLVTGAKVEFIFQNNGLATGVSYNDDIDVFLNKGGTVLMAAGALGTSKVLMQSGIGPENQINLLKQRDAAEGVFRPAKWIFNNNVGRNVFDTNVAYASFAHPDMKSFNYHNRPVWATSLYQQDLSGPWAATGPLLIAREQYDVQGRTYEFQATLLPSGFLEFENRTDAFTLSLYINNPESRAASGFDNSSTVEWKAFNEGNVYLGTDRDLAAMQSYAQRIVALMTAQGATFLSAASDPASVAEWVVKTRGYYVHHFGGGCYVSSNAADPNRCADEKMRVIGTQNIFIADASAMRDGTVNPNAFVMYIGREAADQAKSYRAAA